MKKIVLAFATLAAFASAHAVDRTALERVWTESQGISSACESCISEHGTDIAKEFAFCYQNASDPSLEKCGGNTFYAIAAGVCSSKCSN